MASARAVDGFRPGGQVAGELRVPGSKSHAQRTLVCAALAGGETRVTGLPDGQDVAATRAALERSGVTITDLAPRAVRVRSKPIAQGGLAPKGDVCLGESGTGARLVTAALGFCGPPGPEVRVTASGTLARRASPPLFRALARAEVGVVHEGPDGGWPVRLRPIGPPSDVHLEHPGSSQEASGLVIALAAYPDAIRLHVTGEIPSRPYFAMTLGVLEEFGALVTSEVHDQVETFLVRGPLTPPEDPIAIEPDASSAAVALAAACLSGGSIRVPGFGAVSRQGDVRIAEHLRAFGCDASFDGGILSAAGAPTRGAELDLAGEPDLAPVLAAVAAGAALGGGGASHLRGLETLPGKESSRIEVLARGLRGAGLEVSADERSLSISGASQVPPGEVVLDPDGDHRMAFAFALLGLARDQVKVKDASCVAKSWPGFWSDLEAAGARRT